ncbi:MAG TPA: glycosyltransferase [Mucilaginibacter sp.]
MWSADKIKRVAIICGYSFPEGLAATTRILSYGKGFVENGIKTDIFVYFPTDSQPSSFSADGEIYGINYHYPGTREHPKNKIIRILSHAYYCFIAVFKLLKENKKEKFDFVIISSDWFRILYVFIPVVKLINSRPIFITDEYPVPIRVYLKNSIPKYKETLFKNILKYVKGMIFMTDNLSSFYNGFVEKPSYILPTLTDVSRFSGIPPNYNGPRYLCYMGNMELSKDNVDNIISAFKTISEKYDDLELHLYGPPSPNDLKRIAALIDKLELHTRVILKGKVSNDKVPGILLNSFILVSSQPPTKRAEGGFPTKLGEYMASGKPTLLTNVGEISKFVTDGVNCWLAIPNDPIDYGKKLEYIIDNYPEALKVGERARAYILENFDYNVQCIKLINFLDKLMKN